MPWLTAEFLERVERMSDRILDVAEAIADDGRSRRIVDQMMACGSAVAANLYEADEAMSRADFVRCLSIANKELNEARFWLRLVGRREWVSASRLSDLLAECDEVRRILGSMVARTKKRS